MKDSLYVMKPFRYEKGNKNCSCHQTVRFTKGDQINFISPPFFVDHLGWYIRIQKNDGEPLSVSTDFIETLFTKQAVCTELDLMLAINYQQFKINQALDERNEERFLVHSKAIEDLKSQCRVKVGEDLSQIF
ncbi:hypothetical protein SAMN05421743_101321 [Thalassobacillus cyri]|uniref:IDEAL domain-containing protein n=1 Tax=Thalassobacillus cyri TaxID=571932 RepID=A0A1H3W569_9BACI|nr:hypothetical protein [Thalassobacillus cyri]SDZ82206.1 hypothetical protein SAMN05421743_101321 [Thalassobacillus cyri]